MRIFWLIALILGAATVLLTGGSPMATSMSRSGGSARSAQSATKPVPVAVTLREFTVSASQTTFKVGQPYAFEAKNTGSLEHELVIERAGADDQALTAGGKDAEAEDIAPGQTKTLVWTFTTPGTYQLACHKPGHYQHGMVLTPIIVTN